MAKRENNAAAQPFTVDRRYDGSRTAEELIVSLIRVHES